eukprot:GILJ01015232.1.p1 GENE.GILJ01015232.1~~GILJ01015232.1.p1  ORF type:complete len:893 (-),score=148.82 GILJ01015232.1:1241-3919(-)
MSNNSFGSPAYRQTDSGAASTISVISSMGQQPLQTGPSSSATGSSTKNATAGFLPQGQQMLHPNDLTNANSAMTLSSYVKPPTGYGEDVSKFVGYAPPSSVFGYAAANSSPPAYHSQPQAYAGGHDLFFNSYSQANNTPAETNQYLRATYNSGSQQYDGSGQFTYGAYQGSGGGAASNASSGHQPIFLGGGNASFASQQQQQLPRHVNPFGNMTVPNYTTATHIQQQPSLDPNANGSMYYSPSLPSAADPPVNKPPVGAITSTAHSGVTSSGAHFQLDQSTNTINAQGTKTTGGNNSTSNQTVSLNSPLNPSNTNLSSSVAGSTAAGSMAPPLVYYDSFTNMYRQIDLGVAGLGQPPHQLAATGLPVDSDPDRLQGTNNVAAITASPNNSSMNGQLGLQSTPGVPSANIGGAGPNNASSSFVGGGNSLTAGGISPFLTSTGAVATGGTGVAAGSSSPTFTNNTTSGGGTAANSAVGSVTGTPGNVQQSPQLAMGLAGNAIGSSMFNTRPSNTPQMGPPSAIGLPYHLQQQQPLHPFAVQQQQQQMLYQQQQQLHNAQAQAAAAAYFQKQQQQFPGLSIGSPMVTHQQQQVQQYYQGPDGLAYPMINDPSSTLFPSQLAAPPMTNFSANNSLMTLSTTANTPGASFSGGGQFPSAMAASLSNPAVYGVPPAGYPQTAGLRVPTAPTMPGAFDLSTTSAPLANLAVKVGYRLPSTQPLLPPGTTPGAGIDQRKRKTRLCKSYPHFISTCPFGDKCAFAHSKDELSRPAPAPNNTSGLGSNNTSMVAKKPDDVMNAAGSEMGSMAMPRTSVTESDPSLSIDLVTGTAGLVQRVDSNEGKVDRTSSSSQRTNSNNNNNKNLTFSELLAQQIQNQQQDSPDSGTRQQTPEATAPSPS